MLVWQAAARETEAARAAELSAARLQAELSALKEQHEDQTGGTSSLLVLD